MQRLAMQGTTPPPRGGRTKPANLLLYSYSMCSIPDLPGPPSLPSKKRPSMLRLELQGPTPRPCGGRTR